MNYELAKKLKDAGFPQDYKAGDYVYFQWQKNPDVWKLALVDLHGSDHKDCGYGKCNCECNVCYPFGNDGAVKAPTLSELIEACGDKFVGLDDFGLQDGAATRWKVFGKHNEGNCSGSTPEEAVANFWLGLSKK